MTQRSWQTATFWLDTLERTVRSFIMLVLSILAATTDWPQNWSNDAWRGLIYGTIITFLMCMLASGIGEVGTASVLNPAPPDTLKDKGLSLIETIVLVVVIVLALFGLIYFFGNR